MAKKDRTTEYEMFNSELPDEYFHYRCIDCGFEEDVIETGCGADHGGGPIKIQCYKCGGTFQYTSKEDE